MKKIFLSSLILFVINSNTANAWGVYGHKHIVHAAIFALPLEMGVFFYNHTDFLTEESVVPDIRKYTIGDKAEFPRHYINLEAYGYTIPMAMPQTMQQATAKYPNDSLQRHGILPWYIQVMMTRLTTAFRNGNSAEILVIAADLSHYIADAHMPLHTTINHNGQLTGQKGIHAFWESQLPEMFGDSYNYHIDDAHYLPDVTQATWAIIAHTYSLADTMLLADRELKKTVSVGDMYAIDTAGNLMSTRYGDPVHSKAYATKYNGMLHGMVERQMRLAIQATADFWYTAWVNAGKPDLMNLDPKDVTERNKAYFNEDRKEWEKGKISGFETYKEF
jgi:hypothetical protein